MTMGTRTTNPTTIANGLMVPQIWTKLILNNLDDYGVMADCVNKDYEGEIRYAGDTVRIPSIGDITVRTHADGTPITYDTPTGSEQILLIDQQKEWGFRLSTIEMKQANVKDLQAKYSGRAKVAITNTKDTALHTLGIAGVHSDNDIGTKAATKNNIYDICLDLYQALADSNAIKADGKGNDGKRPYLVVPPAIVKLMKSAPEMTHSTQAADDVIRKGTILQFAGFDVKQSTLIKNDSGFSILAGTTEGITYADQLVETKVSEDKDFFGIYVAGLYVYGMKVVQPKALAKAVLTV